MHMVLGFILASLFKKRLGKSEALPSVIGKLEVAHAIPGRIRYNAPLLEDSSDSLRNRIETELTKIEGIDSAQVNPVSGSLILTYDDAQVKDFVAHGIALKLLGLEEELEHTPESVLLRELKFIGRAVDHQIYQSSAGLLDLRTALTMALASIALYRIVVLRDRTLPGGVNLLWWAYIMSKSGK